MPRIDAATTLYGVVGWPLHATLSPQLHNAAFTALGLPAVYLPLRVPPGRVGDLRVALETLDVRGVNVTVPHKEAALALCDRLSGQARAARSVNTLVRSARGWEGHSTDGPGFLDFLEAAGLPSESISVALLGAGGASRSVAVSLLRGRGVRLRIVSRRPDEASEALRELGPLGPGCSLELLRRGSPEARKAIGMSDLVLNGTSLGAAAAGARAAATLPCPARWLRDGAAAVDFVYGAETPWLRALRGRGLRAFSGLGLLVHQAARSFELWTGQKALSWMRWTGGWDAELEHARAAAGAAQAKPPGAGSLRR